MYGLLPVRAVTAPFAFPSAHHCSCFPIWIECSWHVVSCWSHNHFALRPRHPKEPVQFFACLFCFCFQFWHMLTQLGSYRVGSPVLAYRQWRLVQSRCRHYRWNRCRHQEFCSSWCYLQKYFQFLQVNSTMSRLVVRKHTKSVGPATTKTSMGDAGVGVEVGGPEYGHRVLWNQSL